MPHESDPTAGPPRRPPDPETPSITGATSPLDAPRTAGVESLPPGALFGHYRIESVLGAGGMGVVYRARQERPAREVALKVIRPGFASSQALRRFELEAEVLGRLQHPGIAQVYEAGTAQGQPFFAMELVRGEPLTHYAEAKRLTTRQRLELFARVCEAVQHAHTKGVIHRDLKPGNILVDSSGQPKILDFGVARLTGHDVQAVTIQTDIGQLIGTVPYMSPEQVEGDPASLDTRSDVYALGVILFELLTGRLPYDLSKKLLHEAARIIKEDEPTRLSSINRTLRGDIETIALKALEKDKNRRYQAASDLGSDVTRFLRDEPIVARPASRSYQLRKFAKRNKTLVGGVAAAFILLILGLIGTSYGLVQAETQRRIAEDNAERASAEARRAEEQRVVAEQRAKETEQIAEFQADQLSGVHPEAMGAHLRAAILEETRTALRQAGAADDHISDEIRRTEEALRTPNLTNVALSVLDKSVFQPAIKTADTRFETQPLVRARLLQTVANALRDLGLFDQAADPQERALVLLRSTLGAEHETTYESLQDRALLLQYRGDLNDAEPLLREVLEFQRRTLGELDPRTLTTVGNLGALMHDLGRLDEAEVLSREALEKRRRVLGSDHADTLSSLNNLGVLLQARGKLDEAEACLLEAFERRRRLFGPTDATSLYSMNAMGLLRQAQGRLDEAEHFQREGLDATRRVSGDDHPDTIVSIMNLGYVLQAQSHFEEAEVLLREAAERSQRALGEDHLLTMASMNLLGSLFRAQGKFAEATCQHRETLERRRRALGADHPDTLVSLNNVGLALAEEGKPAEAEPYYREALERSRAVLGPDNPETLISVNNMGTLLATEHKNVEAEAMFREAIAGFVPVLGKDHAQVGNTRLALANLLRAQDRFSEAESEALEAARILAVAQDASPRRREDSLRCLVALYTAWHASEPGKSYDTKAAEWKSKLDALTAPPP